MVIGIAANVLAVPLPHILDGVTCTFPAAADAVTFTVTEFVPCPAVILQPEGNDHVYVTPATFVTE